MLQERDIAYFAGLYEGEGSIWAHHKSATIEISMTDREPLERAQAILGGKLTGPQERGGNRKPRYRWTLHGVAAAEYVFGLVSEYLSPRRLAQFERVIAECDTFEQKPVGPPCDYRGHSSRGAERHREKGEPPCALCRELEREYKASYRNRGGVRRS